MGKCGCDSCTGRTIPRGANGNVWRDGSGVPSNSFGANNDYYLNDTNGDVYKKVGGVYVLVANIHGDDGASAFVYIAYADDNVGTGFTTTFDPTKFWIAIKETTVAIASPVVGDFAGLWFNYKGATGDTGVIILFNDTSQTALSTASAALVPMVTHTIAANTLVNNGDRINIFIVCECAMDGGASTQITNSQFPMMDIYSFGYATEYVVFKIQIDRKDATHVVTTATPFGIGRESASAVSVFNPANPMDISLTVARGAINPSDFLCSSFYIDYLAKV